MLVRVFSGGHPGGEEGPGGRSALNNFRLAKSDARFISSSSQEAIKNNVQVNELA